MNESEKNATQNNGVRPALRQPEVGALFICKSDGTIIAASPNGLSMIGQDGVYDSIEHIAGKCIAQVLGHSVPEAVIPVAPGLNRFPLAQGRFIWASGTAHETPVSITVAPLDQSQHDATTVGVVVATMPSHATFDVEPDLPSTAHDAPLLPAGLANDELNIVHANADMAHQWAAASPNDLAGKPLSMLWVSGRQLDAALQAIKQNGEWAGNLLAQRLDGTTFDAYLTVTRIRQGDASASRYSIACLDLSSRAKTERQLRHRIEIEQLVSKISTELLDAPLDQLDAAMVSALGAVGRYAKADRCFFNLVDIEGRRYGRGCEWCADGVTKHEGILEGRAITGLTWGEETLLNGRDICIRSMDELPPEASELRSLYEQQGVLSNVTSPLIYGGALKGFIGFDATKQERNWPPEIVVLLHMVGEVLAVASERRQAYRELERQMDLERIISSLSTRFINLSTDETGQGVDEALNTLGTFMGVDRAYFNYITDEGQLDGYEWCAQGIESQPNALDNVNIFEDLAWSIAQLAASSSVNIPNVDLLPPEAAFEKKTLKQQDVKSTVIVPVLSRHHFMGFVGFETVREQRVWPEGTVNMLTMVAQMFANAEERRRSESERRRLEQQMRHSQKLESLGVLAGGIAHDFNNLLVGILGNAGIALLELPGNSPVRQSIKHIEDAARHAAELTNQLLAYSGKGQFAVMPVNISKITEDMIGLLESVKSKKAALKCNLKFEIPAIEADSSQIKQIIMNLVTNASDAIGDQEGVIVVSTGTCDADRTYLAQMFLNDNLPEGEYVFLEVSDSGLGMDGDTLQKIFDPFFTTKFTGRGLGLAAVLGIVRSHGGAIRVESVRNHGTTFRVLFPCTDRPVEVIPITKPAGEWKGNGTILVVDDEPIVRDVAKSVLQRFGFAVMTANDGVECLNVYQANKDKISCILLDMTMPVMDGVEVCKALQEIPEPPPVLLTSGYTELETTERIRELQIGGFIQKPYSPNALIDKLREMLDRQ